MARTRTDGSARYVARAVLGAAVVSGGFGLLLFTGFLFAGHLHVTDLGFGRAAALGWDALLSLIFFAQHSGMVRRSFQGRLAKAVAPHLHAAFYALMSGLVLIALVAFWQVAGESLISPPASLRWLLRVLFAAGVAGMVWGLGSVPSFDSFGRGPILAYLRGRSPPRAPFVVKGPYCLVRHPLYASTLLLIWSCPELSADRLLFDVLWTAWVVAATRLEERDLVADFGEAYRDYQRRVPMLLPRWTGHARPSPTAQ